MQSRLIGAVVALCASTALAQSPTLVQQATNSGVGLASITVTLAAPPTAGNVLIVCHDSTSGGLSSVSGGGVSNWTLCQSSLPADNSEIWAGVVDAGPSASTLITLGGSPNTAGASVSEWQGLAVPLVFTGASSVGLDGSAVDPAVSGTVQADANSLVVAMIGVHSGGGETISPANSDNQSFAELARPLPTDNNVMAAAVAVTDAAGPVSTSWVLGFPHNWASVIVAFAASVGSPPTTLAHDGHGIGFWRNRHGLRLVNDHGLLGTLGGLCLVNGSGQQVVPGSASQLASWLQSARATNMAYMLSAQTAAMWFSVTVGFVDPASQVLDDQLGVVTVGDLLQSAIASVCAHPYTPAGSPWRAEQGALQRALSGANSNENWLLP